jgi:metacaspase-1
MARKAVLIGVNRYRMAGADLRGCVNDVRNMKAVLTGNYGFKAAQITTLLDFAATRKAIESAIASLVLKASRGDVLLVHFSGHGSNVPDNDGDEADRRDEILCPTDLDWKDPLTDDFLKKTVRAMPQGVSLTFITDCCHSGTITRAVLPPDAPVMERYLPSPWDLAAVESGRRTRGTMRGSLRQSSRTSRRSRDVVAVPGMREILISGCRADQTSADAWIKGSYNGALTYYLVDVLTNARGPLTNRELHQRVNAKLARAGYDQVPQLEGQKARLDAPFLSPVE